MAALAIAFVVVGFVAEAAPERDAFQYVLIEIGLTVVFMLEFFTRSGASLRQDRIHPWSLDRPVRADPPAQ